jgi:hypothetical protein
MAVRHFDGSSRIELDLGNVSTLNAGAYTVAAIAKRTTDGNDRTLASAEAATSSRRAFMIAPDDDMIFVSGGIVVDSTVSWDSSLDWCLVAITKASGNSTPRFHRYVFDTDTWTHQDGSGTRSDDSEVLDHIAIGQADQSFGFIGRLAVAGAWQSPLSDLTLEGLTDELSAWVTASPDALWPLNQASVTTAVQDITGGGADQVARVGTSVVTGDDPPGFDFALTQTVLGDGSADLGPLTASATGLRTIHGVSLGDLGTLTATGTGQRTVYGVALADLGFTATAHAVEFGTAVADLGLLAATASGHVIRYGVAIADLGALAAHARAPITVTGVAVANLGGLSSMLVGDRSQLPRFILVGPTYQENLRTNDRLFSRYQLPHGTTLAVVNGVVTELIYPYQEDLEQYDSVYLGGFEHRITANEANILIVAGYGEFVTPI